jgi:hypothetical protein
MVDYLTKYVATAEGLVPESVHVGLVADRVLATMDREHTDNYFNDDWKPSRHQETKLFERLVKAERDVPKGSAAYAVEEARHDEEMKDLIDYLGGDDW